MEDIKMKEKIYKIIDGINELLNKYEDRDYSNTGKDVINNMVIVMDEDDTSDFVSDISDLLEKYLLSR